MKEKIKRLAVAGLIFTSAISLIGCGHKNPLLNEDTISFMKENFMLEEPGFPIKECTDYYSSAVRDATLKDKCDKWTQDYYRLLINTGSIPSTATVDDLRDSSFWQRVKPIK